MKKKLLPLFVLIFSVIGYAEDLSVTADGNILIPEICPKPAIANISSHEYFNLSTVTIACKESAATDWALRHLKEWYKESVPKVKTDKYNGDLQGDEEYTLIITEKGVTINAVAMQGVRYALYSLRQLAIPARGTSKVEGWIVPKANIKDKPALNFRGIHICWFQETDAWEVERLIRMAAYYKLNYAVIEPWGTFCSDVAPWYGWKGSKMTKSEINRLKKIADDLGITLIPQLNVFGHATMSRIVSGKHAGLDITPEYQPLFEPVGGWNWCLTNPETRKLLIALIEELHEAFGNPPYFHIGCDEAQHPSCPRCIERPYSEIFIEHLRAMNDAIIKRGARPMMWHDMLLQSGDERWKGFYANGTAETAKAAAEMPKNIVICDWFYGDKKDAYPTLDYFKSLGYTVLTCPWDNVSGISAQGKYAQTAAIDGILGTLWHHYFGQNLARTYVYLSNSAWSTHASPNQYGANIRFMTNLRQIGWDMGVTDSKQTGVYYYQIPPEPTQND